ncbi:hypothetical protein Tco_0631819 [Tanacetum coccineum]
MVFLFHLLLSLTKGNYFAPDEYDEEEWDGPRDYPRGRGRARGRNYRGRGRGGYNNDSYMDAPQDGGYNHEAPVQGRGRGRGRGGRGRGRGFSFSVEWGQSLSSS